MGYEKTVWKEGDVITAEKLNQIENGIETATSSPTLIQVDLELDDENHTFTVTNITAICDMLDDIILNPRNVFNYNILYSYYNEFLERIVYNRAETTERLDFFSLTTNDYSFYINKNLDNEGEYYFCSHEFSLENAVDDTVNFSRSDITSEDTLVLNLEGGGGVA